MIWDGGLEHDSSAYSFAACKSKTICVIAGPGSGKSFAIRRRITRLLEEGVNPKKILAVTFTRAAASDLKQEIKKISIPGSDKVFAKTLHGYCLGLLSKNDVIERTGRIPRPLSDFEKKLMLHDIKEKYSSKFGNNKQMEELLRGFGSAWARLQTEEPGYSLNENEREFEEAMEDWLIFHKAMLFEEMIVESYRFLENNPQSDEFDLFDHILVDEYQDLNKAEQGIIDFLSQKCNVAIVGDDDQSIYSFRNAHPEGIQTYSENHSNCEDIDFEICRRCPKKIVNMASSLISKNKSRIPGDLKEYAKNSEGEVHLVQWKTHDEEIKGISKIICRELELNVINPNDVLVLVPNKKIGLNVSEALKVYDIRSKQSMDLMDFKENRYLYEMINLIKLDDPVALRYILGEGSENSRSKQYNLIVNYSKENFVDIFDVLNSLSDGSVIIKGVKTIVEKYRELYEKKEILKNLILKNHENLISEFSSYNISNEFMDILKISIDLANKYDEEHWFEIFYSNIQESIEMSNENDDENAIRIMTFHSSKGLSAKFVIVMSAVDELIPTEDPKADIEEKRRLFYVAITRCKCNDDYCGKLYISSFVSISLRDARLYRIKGSGRSVKVTNSRFIKDFGRSAPKTESLNSKEILIKM